MKTQRTNNKDLLFELVRTNFKLRYNNSVLGFLWVVLKPLMTFLILYFIFSRFRGEGVENYSIYLLIGIILYNFFSEGILFGMNSLLEKAHIILKVNFPKGIAILSSLLMAFINFVINIGILILFVIFNPIHPTAASIGYFVVILATLFTFIYGIAFFTSIIAVKLRDLQNIFEILLQLGFYLTPIIFPLTFLPERLLGYEWLNPRALVLMNPLTTIVQAGRAAIMTGEIHEPYRIGIFLGVSILIVLLGQLYFHKNVKKIAEQF